MLLVLWGLAFFLQVVRFKGIQSPPVDAQVVDHFDMRQYRQKALSREQGACEPVMGDQFVQMLA